MTGRETEELTNRDFHLFYNNLGKTFPLLSLRLSFLLNGFRCRVMDHYGPWSGLGRPQWSWGGAGDGAGGGGGGGTEGRFRFSDLWF